MSNKRSKSADLAAMLAMASAMNDPNMNMPENVFELKSINRDLGDVIYNPNAPNRWPKDAKTKKNRSKNRAAKQARKRNRK